MRPTKTNAINYLLLVVATGLPVAIGLVVTPLVTSSITTLEYGRYVNYTTIIGVVNIFVGLSSAAYIANAFSHPASTNQIVSSMAFLMLLTLPPAAALACTVAYLTGLPAVSIGAALTGTAVCTYLVSVFQVFMILKKKYAMLLIVALSQVLGQNLIVGVMLFCTNVTVGGLILGSVSGQLLASVCVLILWKSLGVRIVKPKRETVRKVLLYGIPLVPHMFLTLTSASFDRWYLVGAGQLNDLAMYAVAASIANVVMILLDMGNKVYSPAVFETLKNGDPASRFLGAYRKDLARFWGFSVLAGMLVATAGYFFVVHAFDPKYVPAASLCASLALASIGFAIYYSASPFLYFFNQTRLIFFSSFLGALTTVLCSIALFHYFHLYGLILGKFAGFLVTGLVAFGFAVSLLRKARVPPGELSL